MPEEVLDLWASLPRRERQRSRRRYFCDQTAAAPAALLSTIDARVRDIESALAEFLHTTAASIPVFPLQSSMKRTREDAGSPLSPAPASTSDEMISDISRAGKLCSDALSPLLPALNISTLAALCAADELMAEPTAEPTPTMRRHHGRNGRQPRRLESRERLRRRSPAPTHSSLNPTRIRQLCLTDRLHPTGPVLRRGILC